MNYEEFLREWNNDKNFIIAHTSGSTGNPKEIKLDKDFVRESAIRTINFFEINNDSRLHSCVSPDFIGGKMMGVRAEIAKCRLTWESPSNLPLRELNDDEIIDLLAVVPSQMDFIVNYKNSLPKIRNIIVGGASIPKKLREKIADSGLNAYETYGMTETASHIAIRKITKDELAFNTLRGITVSIDEDGALKILFANGKEFQTNDLAKILSPSEFFITGRRDNIINSGGKKVNPVEIEKKIEHLIPTPFIIAGFPDDKWGQRIVMIIERSSVNITEIKEKCGKVLEGWMVPKEVIVIDKLPLTANGKIKRPKSSEDLFPSLS